MRQVLDRAFGDEDLVPLPLPLGDGLLAVTRAA
jgi:hypothetical protein